MKNKSWGGRFKKGLDERASLFLESISFDHKLFIHDISGSKVHAKMLARQGLITPDEADVLVDGLEKVKKKFENKEVIFNPLFEDIHMHVEQELLLIVGDVAKKLHTGRSRNDQVALDVRLFIRDEISQIVDLINRVILVLDDVINSNKNIIMPGYTHLQQAQPVKLETHLGAYVSMLKRDRSRYENCWSRMNFCPLGAGALAGSGLPLDRDWVAGQLGFDGIVENTMDAVSDRDFAIEFCSVSAILMMHLSRLSEDLILWASSEFGFIKLDDSFSTGSSLMPNKKNPDIPELVRGKSGRVYGSLMGVLTVMKGLPMTYNKDMQEDKEHLFDVSKTVKGCLSILAPFLDSISFEKDRMKYFVDNGFMSATALVEQFVLSGMSFRDAHHKVGEMVAEAMATGKKLEDLI